MVLGAQEQDKNSKISPTKTVAITYALSIKNFECVKKFLLEIHELSSNMKKNDFWEPHVRDIINCGLKVTFIHLWDTKEQWFDGVHYEKEMVFEVFIGFNVIGMTMYSMGTCSFRNIETLSNKYERNPDFIFNELDWDAKKEDVVNDFLSELKEYDFVTEQEFS